ncbi:MAG: diacylglycerol kinase family lipid kinase [Bacteroidales bacterium]|jgi:YegS/Rv2252/BmrU family lipid kinase|nr:diacylglycerol kinase family lipid kinase [Bacteroidales bacterium]MDX9797979.1 diacylglycerol kinase family lipid kinase [Bacteroidales bacterium]
MKKSNILFIINPISGIGKQRLAENAIEKVLDKTKFDYKIAYTEYAHHGTVLSLQAAIQKVDIVVAVGGDGSINDCVRGLIGTEVTLGIIPAGSGNGLARTLNIPLNMEAAIEVLNKKETTEIDTIKVNNKIYASIAGIGFDALIASEFRKAKIRGFNKYLALILQHYPFYEPQTYRIEFDDQVIEEEALFISFANSNQFGFDTIIAPSAKVDDGFIQVCIVKKVPLVMIPLTIQLLLLKNFDKSIYVKTFKAKEVKVTNNDSLLVNLDGESAKMDKELNFSVNPQSLNIIIPKNNVKERKEQNWYNIFNQPLIPIRNQ